MLLLLCLLPAAEPVIVPGDAAHQLFLDDRLVESSANVALRLGAVTKGPARELFAADLPWENATNNLYPNVTYDPAEKRLRLWYKCVVHDKDAIARMKDATTIHGQGWYLLHAESADGLRWDRPLRDDFPFAGRPTNAVAQETPNAGVFRDAHDPDPARRFKLVFDTGLGRLRTSFSADGRKWSAPATPTGFGPRHGDTHNNAFWDDRLGRYVLFTKLYLGERLVSRFESKDFATWTDSGVVLRSSAAEGGDVQTYCLTAFPYGNVWLGYVMMYRAGTDRAVDCELAWSPDSVTWRRVAPGTPFIPRGKKGSGDSACVYAQAGPALVRDGQLQILYGGSDTPHVGWKRNCLLRLATLRPDGFAGLAPVERAKPSFVVTQPLRVTADRLSLRLDGGSARVRVLDAPAFADAPSEPISADGPVAWKGRDFSSLKNRVIRLRIDLDGATLYSVAGAEQLPRVVCDTDARRFGERLTVTFRVAPVVGRSAAGWVVRYTDNGTAPTPTSPVVPNPVTFDASAHYRLRAFRGDDGGAELDAAFLKIDPRLFTTPPAGKKAVAVVEDFAGGSGGWKGTDNAEVVAAKGGPAFLRVSRLKPFTPFARLTPTKARPLGDLPAAFGSPAARLSWKMRVAVAGGKSRVEVLAGGGGGWYRESAETLTAGEWRAFAADVRFDWTDDEARNAGWRRTANGFPWAETWKHVSSLVIGPTAQGGRESFDLADVKAESAW